MKRFKRIFVLVVALISLSVVSLVVESCDNDTNNAYELDPISNDFLQQFGDNLNDILSIKPISSTSTRCVSEIITPEDDSTTVYIGGIDGLDFDANSFGDIECLGDLIDLTKALGVEISYERTAICIDSISFSNNEAKETLSPLVRKSKEYLYTKGFTDVDIQEMLDENNVDETSLVPFVLACIEVERINAMTATVHQTIPLSSFFATNVYAHRFNWKKASNCALEALGVNALAAFSQSNLKTWGVVAMKKAFKTIATKVVGPIGALITVGYFSYCYIK